MSRLRASRAPRDQADSAFSGILDRLCDDTGALATVLVDRDGESVDYAGYLEPYDVKVTAAELQLVLRTARKIRTSGLGMVDEITVRASTRSFAIIGLSDGYVLVLVLSKRGFRISRRGIASAIGELAREAGLTYSSGMRPERWARVQVRSGRSHPRRPEAIRLDGSWQSLAILGRVHSRDLEPREVGYRARLASGAEFALVREPPGRWFAEGL